VTTLLVYARAPLFGQTLFFPSLANIQILSEKNLQVGYLLVNLAYVFTRRQDVNIFLNHDENNIKFKYLNKCNSRICAQSLK